jgi:hypothetical protein
MRAYETLSDFVIIGSFRGVNTSFCVRVNRLKMLNWFNEMLYFGSAL